MRGRYDRLRRVQTRLGHGQAGRVVERLRHQAVELRVAEAFPPVLLFDRRDRIDLLGLARLGRVGRALRQGRAGRQGGCGQQRRGEGDGRAEVRHFATLESVGTAHHITVRYGHFAGHIVRRIVSVKLTIPYG